MSNFKTVFDVVKHELCLGCGMCAVVCPEQAIKIEYSCSQGHHIPIIDTEKCTNCGLCLKSCSGYKVDHKSLNLDKFGNTPENPFLGNYEDILVGHSCDDEFRSNGASGGVVAHILMNMIKSKKIDAALVVIPNENDFYSPKLIFARTKNDLIASQGSYYMNVPVGIKLKELLNQDIKIALVGLPCLLNSLQKCYKVLPQLKSKIKYTIGLFCNGVYSGNSISDFCKRKDIDLKTIQRVEFRRGDWPGSMKFTFKDGREEFHKRDKYFQSSYLNRCYYCYDFLADLADVSIGDNWLPQNRNASNVIVLRNPEISKFLSNIETKKMIVNDFMESHRLYHSRRRYTSALITQGKLHCKTVPMVTPSTQIPVKFWNHIVAWLDWKRQTVKPKNLIGFMKFRGTILESVIYARPIAKEYLAKEIPTNKTVNVLITEGDVVGNKGAVAMTNCLIRDIISQIPDVQFVVTSKHIKKDVNYYENVKTLYDNGPHFEISILAAGLWYFFKLFGLNLKFLLNNKIAQAYLKTDLVISATGISFIEEFGNKKIYHFSKYLLMPLILNRKVIKLTQSFGPIKSRYNKFMTSSLLPRITKVMARGEISRSNLAQNGIKINVISLPDLAVTLNKTISKKVEEIKKKYKGQNIIGISPNIVCRNLTSDNLYLKEMKKICEFIIACLSDYQILFIPHTITEKTKGKNDDMWLCKKLSEKLPAERVEVIDTTEFSPTELKSLISISDFFIGSRYHALVAAVSSNIPCLAIGWHSKYNELMAWYKLEENIVNIWDLGKVDVVECFRKIFDEKDKIESILIKANPEVKSIANRATSEIIAELKK